MSEEVECEKEESGPRICFRNEQIDKYLPADIEKMNIGDVINLTVKCKVTELSKRKEMEFPTALSDKEKPKEKVCRNVDLEIVSEKKDATSEALKSIGKNAMDNMRKAMTK